MDKEVKSKEKKVITSEERNKRRTDFLLAIIIMLSVFSGALLWYVAYTLDIIKTMLG